MKVFVAGATGSVGRRLVPQLLAAGHTVVASTNTPSKVGLLRSLGAELVVLDGLDAAAVGETVARVEPEAVIHQMTALAGANLNNLRRFDRLFQRTNELRTAGLDHLLAAAVACGAKRFVAQSFTGWPNAREGSGPKNESDPLDPNPPAAQRQSFAAIQHLEWAITGCSELAAVALRYGLLYGPGASEETADAVRKCRVPIVGDGGGVWSFLHVDDAASAAVAAINDVPPGVYNIVDDEPAPVSEWLPYFANAVGAKPPRRVPLWLARLAAGEVGVSMMTQIRGSSNAKAKAQLDWKPRWASWREGFVSGLRDEPAHGPS